MKSGANFFGVIWRVWRIQSRSQRSRSQHSDQMAQLIFDIAGNGNSVADFLAQQELITVAKPMESLPDCILRHAQSRSDLCPRWRSRFVGQQLLQQIKYRVIARGAVFVL